MTWLVLTPWKLNATISHKTTAKKTFEVWWNVLISSYAEQDLDGHPQWRQKLRLTWKRCNLSHAALSGHACLVLDITCCVKWCLRLCVCVWSVTCILRSCASCLRRSVAFCCKSCRWSCICSLETVEAWETPDEGGGISASGADGVSANKHNRGQKKTKTKNSPLWAQKTHSIEYELVCTYPSTPSKPALFSPASGVRPSNRVSAAFMLQWMCLKVERTWMQP